MELRFGDAIDEHISKLNPLATVYIGIFQAVSRAAVNHDLTIGYVPWGPWGRAVFFVETPFEGDPLGNTGPRGLRYYAATADPSQQDALRFMLYGTQKLHTMMQLSANAAAFPIHMRLMSIRADGNVPFRELLWEPEITHAINTRIVDDEATKQLFSAVWRIEDERLARAAVQYEVAMRRLQSYETLLAIEHLYMGVETILTRIRRIECRKYILTRKHLADRDVARLGCRRARRASRGHGCRRLLGRKLRAHEPAQVRHDVLAIDAVSELVQIERSRPRLSVVIWRIS